MVCGVWCVVCGVWCVVCGVWSVCVDLPLCIDAPQNLIYDDLGAIQVILLLLLSYIMFNADQNAQGENGCHFRFIPRAICSPNTL